MNRLAFLGTEFFDSARDFAGYAVFGSFGLSLDHDGLGAGYQVSHNGNHNEDDNQCGHADEKVIVLFLFHSYVYYFISSNCPRP